MSVPYGVFLAIIIKNSIKIQGTRYRYMEGDREKRECPSTPHQLSKQEVTSAHKLSQENAELETSRPAGYHQKGNTIGDLFVGTFYMP